MNSNGNSRKSGKELGRGDTVVTSFSQFGSFMKRTISHKMLRYGITNVTELSDARVKAIWSELKAENVDRHLSLEVPVATMRSILKSGISHLNHEYRTRALVRSRARA